MSTCVNKLVENCYIMFMPELKLSAWIEKKFLAWQMENGRGSVDEFAKYLSISQGYLSQLMSGARKSTSMKTAVNIARRLDDYSILDILGYELPKIKPVAFSSLPPEFLDLLKSIDGEIRNTLRERAITEYSPAAELVAAEILEKYGARLISTTKSGKSSKQ